ncbi:MAG: hypothetical protein M3Z33_04105 [Actinomycetota bacterium]|nr:hypothetical protein [Actinomycetota bacterium]
MRAVALLIAGVAAIVAGPLAETSRRDRWTPLHTAALARTEVAAARIGGSV